MATLAEELLNDFGDSGSEGEQNEFHDEEAEFKRETNGHDNSINMDLDAKIEDEDDADMKDSTIANSDDEKDIENISFGHVHDVRAISTMRTTLDPVLEVSLTIPSSHHR